MRKNEFLSKFLFLLSLIVIPAILAAQTPIWEENFNGPAIDKNVWTYDVGGSGMGNGELQNYTDRPVNSYVENGNLVIQALRENFGGNQFTSARLKTHGRFSFKYGTIEARIKLPNLKDGLWPAFWAMGNNIGQVGWPKCGELDILEAGFEAARLQDSVNKKMSGAVHWWHDSGTWGSWLQADASAETRLPSGNFYDDYHIFKMVWDNSHIELWLDNTRYFNMPITDPNMSEFHQPNFLLLNLAVGGSNYVGITNPAQITAPFPAKMYVDYIRIYPIAGQTEIFTNSLTQKSGNYGVFSENTGLTDKVNYTNDGHIYIWNNMPTGSGAAYEGSEVMNYNIAAGAWWGMGVFVDNIKNMSKYSDGYLRLMMKTTTTDKISVGVASASGEGWLDLINGGEQFGLVRDGTWREVRIPLNRFGVDFYTIHQMFMMKGDAPATAFNLAVDDIYWIESVARPTPENGNFGVFTDNTPCVMKFNTPADGNFFIWSNTLNTTTTTPREGANVISLASASGQTWFGAAFTPNVKYNLTAFRYPESRLHFDIKTSSTATFQIGMKSGNINDIGQKWITFQNGSDPYGLVRNGQWQSIEIPMSAFDNIDLSQVSQLFELLGTSGPISDIAIDNIYFTGGGSAIHEGVSVPVTGVSVAPTSLTLATGAASQLTATVAPANASNKTVSWSSSNTAVATVSATGLVTAIGPGSATINVTTQDGNKTAACAVTVTIPVSSVSVSPTSLTLAVGATGQLTATVSPSNATNKNVSWSSGNTSVATVSASGLVTGVSAGTATITVTTQDGSKTASCAVTVSSGTNIALNKPVTVSSTENAGTPGAAAVDGSAGTRWSSAFSDPQWIMVDLQGTYSINRVVLNWETAAGRNYQVQVSPDGSTNWTTIYSTTTGAAGVVNLNVSGSGRYIRMYGTARATAWGYSLWEFEVYGTPAAQIPVTGVSLSPATLALAPGATSQLTATVAPANATNKTVSWSSGNPAVATVSASGLVTALSNGTAIITVTTQDGNKTATSLITVSSPTTNIALNKPATSSSVEAGFVAANANDGSTATRWSSLFADPQWVAIDLQNTYSISRVVLNWETASGRNYTIQVSNDNVNWTTVSTITNGTTGANINTINLTNATGRYIRMYGTARNTQWGYSLYEFEVYGVAAKSAEADEAITVNTPESLKYYPNPVHDRLMVEFSAGTYSMLDVFDMNGRSILQMPVAEGSFLVEVDMEGLQSGIYIVKLNGNNGSRSFIVSKN
ncbi:MAG: Ig-like domain-containing protein [Bacteroidales bacterium]|nr:Ig-like domain-containing protein [Bacteroidales bacterium]